MDKSEKKKVYAFDAAGKYLGERLLDWTDRSPISGRWQFPVGCTDIEIPKERKGYVLYFDLVKRKWINKKEPEIPKAPEPPVPTKEEKFSVLDAQYEAEKNQLMQYFNEANFAGDTEEIENLKAEKADLDDWYIAERKKIEGSEE